MNSKGRILFAIKSYTFRAHHKMLSARAMKLACDSQKMQTMNAKLCDAKIVRAFIITTIFCIGNLCRVGLPGS